MFFEFRFGFRRLIKDKPALWWSLSLLWRVEMSVAVVESSRHESSVDHGTRLEGCGHGTWLRLV